MNENANVSLWAQIAPQVVEAVGLLVITLISLALNELRRWLASKTSNGVALSVGRFIVDTTESIVGGLEQTVVKPAKAALADGRISKEEYASILANAKQTAIEKTVTAVTGQFGGKVAGKLGGVVSHAVETAVLERSNVERLVKAAESDPTVNPTQP